MSHMPNLVRARTIWPGRPRLTLKVTSRRYPHDYYWTQQAIDRYRPALKAFDIVLIHDKIVEQIGGSLGMRYNTGGKLVIASYCVAPLLGGRTFGSLR